MANFERIQEKLGILADAAKYDVSCSSSNGKRTNTSGGLGDSSRSGICHTYTEDGRCVSLLKILFTNHCVYDCAYCVSRRTNDIKRVAFTVDEVVALTINFYRRNYIEGLFLSSGVFKNADYTMERLISVAKKLRTEENFHGYIHLKCIPGASETLVKKAGLYADRLSVNLEIPTEEGLKLLAPDKSHQAMIKPMKSIQNEITVYSEEKKIFKSVPKYAPAGQSTQLIVGAAGETDLKIIEVANYFYRKYRMKRVYYSGYVPVSDDSRLPSVHTKVPLVRENRLYQTDWLIRFYGFKSDEILDSRQPFLDLEIDPKLAWAIRNRHEFPVNINTASKEMLLRVPGIGVASTLKILSARRFGKLNLEHLKRMGIATNRARYFIEFGSPNVYNKLLDEYHFRAIVLRGIKSKNKDVLGQQLTLF